MKAKPTALTDGSTAPTILAAKQTNDPLATLQNKLQVVEAIQKLQMQGMTQREKMRVLHFCGSCTSEYYKGVSMYYAAECLKSATEAGTFENFVAIVDLDGRWSFPEDLSEEKVAKAPKMEAGEAMRMITTGIR